MWEQRVGAWVWLMKHLADVRSDMSRFHRVEAIESMRSDRLMEYAVRLSAYDGVVASRLRQEVVSGDELSSPSSGPPIDQIAANPSPQELMALNNTALYGPLQGEEVGLFNVRVIGGDSG
jgi:hypothetical protein